MRTVFFNLTKLWDSVKEFFYEFNEGTDIEGDSFSCSIDSDTLAICWLSQRIYEKSGIVNLEIQEITLPFETEIAIYKDSENLKNIDIRLMEFDAYLDFINFNKLVTTDRVVMEVISRIMVMVEK